MLQSTTFNENRVWPLISNAKLSYTWWWQHAAAIPGDGKLLPYSQLFFTISDNTPSCGSIWSNWSFWSLADGPSLAPICTMYMFCKKSCTFGRPMCGLCLQSDKIGQPGQVMHSDHWNLWQRPILIRICFMYRNHSGYQEQTLGICIWKASLYLVRNRTINNRAWISGVSEFISPLVGRLVSVIQSSPGPGSLGVGWGTWLVQALPCALCNVYLYNQVQTLPCVSGIQILEWVSLYHLWSLASGRSYNQCTITIQAHLVAVQKLRFMNTTIPYYPQYLSSLWNIEEFVIASKSH